ncbi:uncharacterized protein LOC143523177 [Brachyhypopomus gauderio]|uniref:uncharacterized protein LOC143523177 n=1 Tax=Brachyhypopomus gauderio TaxID=698409 RepID=UPI0040428654
MNGRFKISIMGNLRMKSKFLLRIVANLLIHMCVMDSQRPDTYDSGIEFSYTDGQLDHIRQKREAPISTITMTQSTEMTTLTSISTPSSSTQLTTPITITTPTKSIPMNPPATITMLTSTIQMTSRSPLVLEYIIEVEIDMLDTSVMNYLKDLLKIVSFPHVISDIIIITEIDITTVCLPNNTEYQCRCEDQYFWPCDKCLMYQHCDDIISGTCGCLSAIPNDGQFCQPMTDLTNNTICPTQSPSTAPVVLEYIIEAEIDMLDTSVMNYLMDVLTIISFPSVISDNIVITETNITTVCLPNNTKYQCRCEDQYFWPCDKCLMYQHCDDIISGTCGCLSAIPNDGQFCQPMTDLTNNATCPAPSPLTPPVVLDYIIEVEIDMLNTSVMNYLKDQLKIVSYPNVISDIMVITKIDITTVCLLNNTEYKCRCEDQYFWPCEKCLVYQQCDDIISGTCDVLNDGQFCQPITELIGFSESRGKACAQCLEFHQCDDIIYGIYTHNHYPPLGANPHRFSESYGKACARCLEFHQCDDIINGNYTYHHPPKGAKPHHRTTTTSTTTIASTTATTPVVLTHFLSFSTSEEGETPRSTCPISPKQNDRTTTTSTTTIASTTATTPTPTITTTTKIPTATPTSQTMVIAAYNIPLSLMINEPFDFELTIQTSAKYRQYKSTLEKTIDASYRILPHYQPNSAWVTGFSPGSVIVDYTITVTGDNPDLASANNQLITSLIKQGFPAIQNLLTQIVPYGIYGTGRTVYPGSTVTLFCTIQQNNGGKIDWALNSNLLQSTTNNIIDITGLKLTLTNVNSADSGQYSCNKTINSITYEALITITVLPNPNLQTNSSKSVKCSDTTVTLSCCADTSYTVNLNVGSSVCAQLSTGSGCSTCNYIIRKQDCQVSDKVIWVTCQATGYDSHVYATNTFWINATNKEFNCFDQYFGGGFLNDTKVGDCPQNMVGNRIAQCNSSRLWDTLNQADNCILRVIQDLIYKAQNLEVSQIPQITAQLSNATIVNGPTIIESPGNVLGIVSVLKQIASVSQAAVINQPIMMSFLQILDVIASKDAGNTWTTLNTGNTTKNTSSVLLKSIEDMGQKLSNVNFGIITNTIQLKRTQMSAPYSESLAINSTLLIDIPEINIPAFFTFIVFSTLNTVMPARNATNNDSRQSGTSINGDVVVVKAEKTVNNISFSFSLINNSLGNPQCVFWNFDLLDGIGAWDSTGCELKFVETQSEKVTCECNHITSFSILKTPYFVDNVALAYITYIGVGISIGSLVLCLIIETIIWKAMTTNDTSYMQHVSIVNIALSLLIADICFMIGASIVSPGQETPVGPCSAVTFFIHFFYLALFFWMLLSALLLLYRTVMVFSGMSRAKMMAIAFTVGYGAPLLIAVITVASTAGNKGYVEEMNACWLNWYQTKALLAFVIPALTIVFTNFLVLIVVIHKIVRRGIGASIQPDEKHALVVIAICVGILTPLFGLTWGFGIGTMVTPVLGIYVVFATLNSLQGFFILVFGTLLDSKIREVLKERLSRVNTSNCIWSTGNRPSSSSRHYDILRMWWRNGYTIAEGNSSPATTQTNL